MDEAAAFRAGAEAMREAADIVLLRIWHRNTGIEVPEAAKAAADCVDAIRALPLPEPPASLQADGLCGRGA